MQEEWRDVVGYEGMYQVSNLGRVKGLNRVLKTKDGRMRPYKEKIKKLTIGNHGYPITNLGLSDLHCVHRLVAMAFLGSDNPHLHVDHINSIRHDNRVENLQWVTQQQNNAKQHFTRGSQKHNALFTEKDVKHIRDEFDKLSQVKSRGVYSFIARGYGVNTQTIIDIIKKNTWAHV